MFKLVAGGKLPFLLTITLLFLLAIIARHALEERSGQADYLPTSKGQSRRIVSLAPNITESLYALGLGERIVGVTRYCNWPEDTAGKARVGGFGQADLEAVLRQCPDLVILPHDQVENARNLKNLGLEILPFKCQKLDDLLDSIAMIGQKTGQTTEADRIRNSFASAIESAEQKAREQADGKPRPRVLFVAMHNGDAGKLDEVTAIGNDGFYSRLLEMAGGENAWQGRMAFPRLSAESIIRCDPDVIIDVLPSPEMREKVRMAWQELGNLKAVKNDRIHLLADNAHTIPGPRSVLTLDLLSRLLYPDRGNCLEAVK